MIVGNGQGPGEDTGLGGLLLRRCGGFQGFTQGESGPLSGEQIAGR